MLEHGTERYLQSVPPRVAEGYIVVLATNPEHSPEFFAELRRLIGQSRGGILVILDRPAPWRGGPIVGVHVRRDDTPPAQQPAPQLPARRQSGPRRSRGREHSAIDTTDSSTDGGAGGGAARPALGRGLWLGPLDRPEDRTTLCHWPPPLRKRIITGPTTPLMARHTSN